MTHHDDGDNPLEQARAAVRRRAWLDAYERFVEADGPHELAPQDLADLGVAAAASGHYDEALQGLQRAFAACTAGNDAAHAAEQAIVLAQLTAVNGDMAIAGGWFNRARRLLRDLPECPAHGQLVALESVFMTSLGNFDRTAEMAQRVAGIGARLGDTDLQMHALMIESGGHMHAGAVREAVPLMDEAMAAAVSGEVGPFTAQRIYCDTVGAYQQMGEFRRAGEWTDAVQRGNAGENFVYLAGDCRVHRAGILRVRGDWDEAEAEAEAASDHYFFEATHHQGMAFYEIGNIRLHRGDLAAAEGLFQQAMNASFSPQPGLALLRLAQGRPQDALSSIRNALSAETLTPLDEAGMLPAQAEIAIALSDLDLARASADEMDAIADVFGTTGLQAAAATVRGAVQLAEGNAAEAVASLRRGLRLWQQVEVPYEAARARILLAAAHHLHGDDESARTELQAAKALFERLGAVPDAKRTAALLDEYAVVSAPAAATTDRATRTFMFTDIVKSTNLVEAMGDDAWVALLSWHDQTMRSLLATHRGEEVKHAGDGFFFAFEESVSALECAVDIQRTLADHRATAGFAPQVRIGLHLAVATRRGRDYSGVGIHEAARIAALGDGGEILASKQTLDSAPGAFSASQPRTVTLKGISEPMEVVAVNWR